MSEQAGASDEFLAAVGKMIARLARPELLERDDISNAFKRLTETGAAALRVGRASVWRFDPNDGALECIDLFDQDLATHSSGLRLSAHDAPAYFHSLAEERTVAARDAQSDPRTRELDDYLREHDIGAMLDAPIWLAGRLVGVVCHEHLGAAREWTHWEELVAGTLADFASVIFGNDDKARHSRALAEHGNKLEALVEERTRNLREQQLLLQTVFATAPFGMAFFDRECRYLRINDWLAKLNGVPAELTIGRKPSEVITEPEIGRGAELMLESVFQSGKPTVPFEAPKGDGAVLISAYPVEIGGEVVQACCVVVDVSMQRAGERERAQLLESERAAREESEAANRAKDEFLAMLGHELRNPLAPIQTALNLMEILGPVAEKERAVIARQVTHLRRLVDDLLDVTRITRGKLELRCEAVELGDVVAKGVEMASPLLERRKQFLDVHVPPLGLSVDGDLERLGQVVSNLLTNASKFTPVGGRVSVVGRRSDEGLMLSVLDTGEGIAPELLPKLFEAFVQGERRLDQSQGGLGLGLAIVHGIVTAHGGQVTCRSDGVGRGSEFTVVLPPYARRRRTRTPLPAALERSPHAPRRILVVDDNQDAAEMLAFALESFGHETATAFDGPTALAVAADFRPELAVLDLGLPVMDGYELAQKLRELLPEQHLKLVALSGYGTASDRERSRQAGFEQHIAKPIDVAELERLVAQAFD
ncbi:MAG: ATP-binding protein [Myxococcales bacterium]